MKDERVTSIPALIVKHRNISRAALETGLSELTVARHKDDVEMKNHIIIDGRLFTCRSTTKPIPPEAL